MKFIKLLSFLLVALMTLSLFACAPAVEDGSETEDVQTAGSVAQSTDTVAKADAETAAKSDEDTEAETSEGNTEKDPETEAVSPNVEMESFEEFVSFVDYTSTSTRMEPFKRNGSFAFSFTVPEGYMTSLALNLQNFKTPTETELVIRIYEFDGSFATSTEKRALRTEYVDSILSTYTVWFGKNKMPAGKYLVVVTSNAEETTESVKIGSLWLPTTLPEEYQQYELVSYVDGKASKKGSGLYGGFTYVHDVPVNAELEAIPDAKDPEGSAKVIVIGGQSNAVGSSGVAHLITNIGKDKYNEYMKGIDNVKILYRCTSTSRTDLSDSNNSDTFVSVAPGQGYLASNFGPELGLAIYLHENYPDETFYIIKHAIGGASMAGYWNMNNEEKNRGTVLLEQTIDDGLALLKAEGLNPKIVAMLWMQGESDGGSLPGAYKYADLLSAFVNEIRTKYASDASARGIAFIDAATSDSGYWNCYMTVNYVKRQFARQSPLNYYIDTNAFGLTTLRENNDPAHYDSDSMLWLGELFGEYLTKALTAE